MVNSVSRVAHELEKRNCLRFPLFFAQDGSLLLLFLFSDGGGVPGALFMIVTHTTDVMMFHDRTRGSFVRSEHVGLATLHM